MWVGEEAQESAAMARRIDAVADWKLVARQPDDQPEVRLSYRNLVMLSSPRSVRKIESFSCPRRMALGFLTFPETITVGAL